MKKIELIAQSLSPVMEIMAKLDQVQQKMTKLDSEKKEDPQDLNEDIISVLFENKQIFKDFTSQTEDVVKNYSVIGQIQNQICRHLDLKKENEFDKTPLKCVQLYAYLLFKLGADNEKPNPMDSMFHQSITLLAVSPLLAKMLSW
ncbi:MAG: hypothetical protein ACOCWG_06275 [bacterium]